MVVTDSKVTAPWGRSGTYGRLELGPSRQPGGGIAVDDEPDLLADVWHASGVADLRYRCGHHKPPTTRGPRDTYPSPRGRVPLAQLIVDELWTAARCHRTVPTLTGNRLEQADHYRIGGEETMRDRVLQPRVTRRWRTRRNRLLPAPGSIQRRIGLAALSDATRPDRCRSGRRTCRSPGHRPTATNMTHRLI